MFKEGIPNFSPEEPESNLEEPEESLEDIIEEGEPDPDNLNSDVPGIRKILKELEIPTTPGDDEAQE